MLPCSVLGLPGALGTHLAGAGPTPQELKGTRLSLQTFSLLSGFSPQPLYLMLFLVLKTCLMV